jgi:hypothetical protein
MLVSEEEHGARPRGLEARQRNRILGKLDRENPAAASALVFNPPELVAFDEVDVRALPESVALAQSVEIVVSVWHRHARANGVAGSEKSAEIGFERHPQGRNDQVIPTSVLSRPPFAPQIAGSGPRARGHEARGKIAPFFIQRRT